MKSTIRYQLMYCRNASDARNATGESYFVFDTPQEAMTFADSRFFRKSSRIASPYAWERQNDGERFETDYQTEPIMGETFQHYLVVCIIQANPQLEEYEK